MIEGYPHLWTPLYESSMTTPTDAQGGAAPKETSSLEAPGHGCGKTSSGDVLSILELKGP